MKEYKEYRVDTFQPYTSEYFDSEIEARKYGEKVKKNGKHAFLLKHILDGYYDVKEQF